MTIKPNSKISVLMSVFNAEEFLHESIDSVLNQKYVDFELIIINDGSIDDTNRIINSYNDKRIKLYENRQNVGLTQSLNIGLDMCSGEFIARLDGGDLMAEDRLIKQSNYLDHNPEIAVIGSYFKCIDQFGKKVDNLNWPSGIEYNIYRALYGENPVGHPGVLMRREVITSIGGYRNKFYYSQDIDLWLRIYSEGFLIDNIPEYLTLYRIHNNSISNLQRNEQEKYQCLAFKDFYYKLIEEDMDEQVINSYLNLLLFKKKKICYNEIDNILKIFSSLHLALIKRLRISDNTKYYYSQLCKNFKLDRFLNYKLYQLLIINFPYIRDKIIRIL